MPKPRRHASHPAAAQSGQNTPTASGPTSPTSSVIKRHPLWVKGLTHGVLSRSCTMHLSLQSVCVSVRWAPSLSQVPILGIYGRERGDWRLLTSRLSVRGMGGGATPTWVVLPTQVDIRRKPDP